MCLIIVQKEGDSLTDDEIVDIAWRNADGFGVMWHDSGKVRIRKVMPADADEAIKAYRDHADRRECVIHWRMATSGRIDVDMAHPFRIAPSLGFAHNGVIGGWGSKTESDTAELVRRVLRPALEDRAASLDDPTVQSLISQWAGGVFVFLDGRGTVHKLGQTHNGIEHKGRWYSNTYAWDAPGRVVPSWGTYRKVGFRREPDVLEATEYEALFSSDPAELEELADHVDPDVRALVAQNEHCPRRVLQNLLHDEDPDVVEAARENPALPLDLAWSFE